MFAHFRTNGKPDSVEPACRQTGAIMYLVPALPPESCELRSLPRKIPEPVCSCIRQGLPRTHVAMGRSA